jgi:hypothetical protein
MKYAAILISKNVFPSKNNHFDAKDWRESLVSARAG